MSVPCAVYVCSIFEINRMVFNSTKQLLSLGQAMPSGMKMHFSLNY
ncbi:hypothetical protein DNTS_001624 [Danionella cerebrum]|uniref:Uncharacterized protein n=1 Tax=Danionella cerebrum TaxID=2873325 RepID=A0A553MN92_9TELE|nr:hypothetical protein DNTS_001624 [Danionella translucida]